MAVAEESRPDVEVLIRVLTVPSLERCARLMGLEGVLRPEADCSYLSGRGWLLLYELR